MKHLRIAISILFLFSFAGLKAQQNHFIYIQTENRQPFYVKLDKKIYSSSASGYLLIAKLQDGNYNLAIGFPKSEWPEQNMLCTVDNNDIGYLLKNFESRGWGLFNLQTSAVIMTNDNGKVSSNNNNTEVVNKTDAFSNMLSNVVNDSTIRQTQKADPVAIKETETVQTQVPGEPPKEEPRTEEIKEAKGSSARAGEIEKTGITNGQAAAENGARSVITRNLFNKNADGTEMVFVDDSHGKKDTITVFIPADKNSGTSVEDQSRAIEKPKDEEPKPVSVKQEEKTKDARFLEIEISDPNKKPEEKKPVESTLAENKATENKAAENTTAENKDTVKLQTANIMEKSPEPVFQKTPMINSDCKTYASGEDFLKLRKKMVAEDSDDEMIAIARKVFKTRCFTVEQVKNLSVLFLKDTGKYSFFDMAYPFVSDSHNFNTLQNQLSETYYINRFQVMIRH